MIQKKIHINRWRGKEKKIPLELVAILYKLKKKEEKRYKQNR